MPRFVVVTNGRTKTTSFSSQDENEAKRLAERYEKWLRAMHRTASEGRRFIRLSQEERDKLVEAEPIDDFEIRRVYKQPRRSPRDFRTPEGKAKHKKVGKYNSPS